LKSMSPEQLFGSLMVSTKAEAAFSSFSLGGNHQRFKKLFGAHRFQKHSAEKAFNFGLVVGFIGNESEVVSIAVTNPANKFL